MYYNVTVILFTKNSVRQQVDDNIYFKLKYKPSFNELLPANQQFFHDNTPLINQLKGVSRILQVFFCQSACI